MIKVGDVLTLPVLFDVERCQKMEGKIVWIHPKKRFCRAEFILNNGAPMYSCYQMVNGRIMLKSGQKNQEGVYIYELQCKNQH